MLWRSFQSFQVHKWQVVLIHVHTEGTESWLLVQMVLFRTLLKPSSSRSDQDLLIQEGVVQRPGSQKVCQCSGIFTACSKRKMYNVPDKMCIICICSSVPDSIRDKQNTHCSWQLAASAFAATGLATMCEQQSAFHCACTTTLNWLLFYTASTCSWSVAHQEAGLRTSTVSCMFLGC